MLTTEERCSNRHRNWFKHSLGLIALVLLILAGSGAAFAAGAEQAGAFPSCPPPQGRYIWPPTLPDGTLGAAYSQPLYFSVGTGADAWSISSGALPDGLTLNAGSGLISGTPTTTGTYNFTVRVEKVTYSCVASRNYNLVIKKAVSATTLTASVNDVAVVGQAITLTAQVSAPPGAAPTGTVQFQVNGSPTGGAVPLLDGVASLNITAPGGGSRGYFTVGASYSGDASFSPSGDGLSVTVFDFSVQDDTTGDHLFFSSNGAYLFKHCAGESSLVLKGMGVILPSASSCTLFLEHITADRELTVEVNTCKHTGSAAMVYQRATYTISDSDTSDNTNACEPASSIHPGGQ